MIKLTKLAKDLGVTKATLYNWKNLGKLDFIKTDIGKSKTDIITDFEQKNNIKVNESNVKDVIAENPKEWAIADIKEKGLHALGI
jgi:predicted site-specific integrase-resolvase